MPVLTSMASEVKSKDVNLFSKRLIRREYPFRIDQAYQYMMSPPEPKSFIYLAIHEVDLQTKAYPFARFAEIEISKTEDEYRLSSR